VFPPWSMELCHVQVDLRYKQVVLDPVAASQISLPFVVGVAFSVWFSSSWPAMAAREKLGTALTLMEFGEGIGRSWSLRLMWRFLSDYIVWPRRARQQWLLELVCSLLEDILQPHRGIWCSSFPKWPCPRWQQERSCGEVTVRWGEASTRLRLQSLLGCSM
jgi:hypothetical protein